MKNWLLLFAGISIFGGSAYPCTSFMFMDGNKPFDPINPGPSDTRPTISEPQFIQYLLDTSSNVPEAIQRCAPAPRQG